MRKPRTYLLRREEQGNLRSDTISSAGGLSDPGLPHDALGGNRSQNTQSGDFLFRATPDMRPEVCVRHPCLPVNRPFWHQPFQPALRRELPGLLRRKSRSQRTMMPKDWEHSPRVDFRTRRGLRQAAEAIRDDTGWLGRIARPCRMWALAHYSPAASAPRLIGACTLEHAIAPNIDG